MVNRLAIRSAVGGSALQQIPLRYVRAFFNRAEEAYRVLLPSIKDGLECGDESVHVVNADQRRDHLQRLAGLRIDATAAQQSGEFELRINRERTFEILGSWPAPTLRIGDN